MPKVITHEKVLGCRDTDFNEFVNTMTILKEKLGPMVLQFPHFSRGDFRTQGDFMDRLIPFLKKLPQEYNFAVEIRNKEWLDAQLAAMLRDFRVALVLDKTNRGCPIRVNCPKKLISLPLIGLTFAGAGIKGNGKHHTDVEQNSRGSQCATQLVGLIIASRQRSAVSASMGMPTITTEGTLQLRFNSFATFGLRRGCRRVGKHWSEQLEATLFDL